jgi:hypothetical protein
MEYPPVRRTRSPKCWHRPRFLSGRLFLSARGCVLTRKGACDSSEVKVFKGTNRLCVGPQHEPGILRLVLQALSLEESSGPDPICESWNVQT